MFSMNHRRFLDTDSCPNPSKKPRLDDGLSDWDQNGGSEDVWAQGDLTAEEFEILEMESTQKILTNTVNSHVKSSNHKPTSSEEEKERRNQNYALEGRIKILNESLDKTVRELNMERINRDQIISTKIEEYKNREMKLKKELEKMHTSLQFKEQEMRATQTKVQHLEHKLKEIPSKESSSQQNNTSPGKKETNAFLKRFQFNKVNYQTKDSSMQTTEKSEHRKLNQLKLISPEGQLNSVDILSNFLANRGNIPLSRISQDSGPSSIPSSTEVPFIAFAQFHGNQASQELWQHYSTSLKQHISFLKKLTSLSHGKSKEIVKKSKTLSSECSALVSSTFQQMTLGEEMEMNHLTINTSLKDLCQLCLLDEDDSSIHPPAQEQNDQITKWLAEMEIAACSNPLFTDEEKLVPDSHSTACLQHLIVLLKQDTYPECYNYKNDEVDMVLTVLVAWSKKHPSSIEPIMPALPIYSLLSGCRGHRCACLTLKMLTNLIAMKNIEDFFHKSGRCLLSSVADLCHNVSCTAEKDYAEIVASISNFLGQTLSVLGSTILNEEICPCSTELSQGFVIMVWRFHNLCYKKAYSSSCNVNILKRCIVMLHQLYTKVTNFQEKRSPVEDQYIALITSFSKLAKDRSQLKYLQDIVHDLWDFQDEGSDEFDDN